MRLFTLTLFSLTLYLLSSNVFSQTLEFDQSSEIKIIGTSTLHDWESISKTVSGSITVDLTQKGSDAIQQLSMNVPVKSIKSGKNKMDELTYEAFDEPNNPAISFVLKSIEKTSENETVAHGVLSMAGQSKNISVKGKANVETNKVTISGSHTIDMTDYGMTPPTAMLGTIKVGKDVTIEFNLVLIK